jgi:uracil-DNA glycosylase
VKERAKVRQQISTCRACALWSVGNGPVPFSAPISYGQKCKLVVIGEAPGKVEDELGKPLVGPSGELVRSWLTETGLLTSAPTSKLENGDSNVDIAWMNVVSCWPKRTPNGQEVTACAQNVRIQLELLSPSYALILGGVALSALCPQRTRISEAHGYWWKLSWQDSLRTFAWAMATWHPAAVLRNKSLEQEAVEDVEYFSIIAREEMTPVEHQFCVKCKDVLVDHVTDCGLGYCARCYTFAR